MAELTPQERLQPSLLDRLTDDEPNKQQESREQRVLSATRLRQCVLRDLKWLLNAGNVALRDEVGRYPDVVDSVVNYGMPALAGNTAHSVDVVEIERLLKQVIWNFEPRILRPTLKVRADLSEERMSHNALVFEIEGELWAQPVPEHLYIKTEIDLEGGKVDIQDYSGSVLR